mmetsp:Transcript_60757/g.131757  ORF Transcript_60757/g.131757 Transcript_60757/m.131757 type:complete len:205 (+) Transcript_60757:646-1260(+)
MPNTDTLTLDGVPAPSRAVQQDVDKVVVKQVDLIHVENATVGLGQQAGLKGLLALSQCLLDIDRAADPVLRGTQGQINHRNLLARDFQLLLLREPRTHLIAHHLKLRWRRVVGVLRHAFDLWEQVHQGSNGGRLPSASVTHDHHSSNLWVDHIEDQCQLHLALTDDCGEGEDGPVILLLGLRLRRLNRRSLQSPTLALGSGRPP